MRREVDDHHDAVTSQLVAIHVSSPPRARPPCRSPWWPRPPGSKPSSSMAARSSAPSPCSRTCSHRHDDPRAAGSACSRRRGCRPTSCSRGSRADPAVEQAFVPPEITLPTEERARRATTTELPDHDAVVRVVSGLPRPGAARHRCAGGVAARLRRAGRVVRRHRGRLERAARGSARRSHHARRAASRSTIATGARTAPRCSARSSAATTARASSASRPMSSACSRRRSAASRSPNAIDAAAEQLRAGDVLLIELQGAGPRGRYLPMEYWDDNYDAIEAATAARRHRDRGRRQRRREPRPHGLQGQVRSQAGATPARSWSAPAARRAMASTDRERLDFSNYGCRVDVQGWGRMVATLDYGDLQACSRRDAPPIATTRTSSPARRARRRSSPAPRSSLAERTRSSGGRVLSPRAAARPAAARPARRRPATRASTIGPRPDLARAIEALERGR